MASLYRLRRLHGRIRCPTPEPQLPARSTRGFTATHALRIEESPGSENQWPPPSPRPRPPPEDFYKYYLSSHLPKTGIEPLKWLNDLDPVAARTQLPAEFMVDPLAVLQSEQANLDSVGQCLEAFISGAHSQAGGLEMARSTLTNAKAGTRTLRWLVGTGIYDEADLSLNPRLFNCLIHCLAGEKGRAFIWDWLKIEHIPRAMAHLPIRQSRAWKGVGLTNLIKNEVFWHDESTAISSYLTAIEWSHSSFRRTNGLQRLPKSFVPCRQAGIWLYRRLTMGPGPDTFSVDPQLYEDFIRTIPLILSDHFDGQMAMCNLFLRHPTRPTAEPAYLHIMSWEQDDSSSRWKQDFLSSTRSGIVRSIRTFVVRTAQMLHRENDLPAAKRVLDVARRRRPDLFNMRGLYTFSNDLDKYFVVERPEMPHKPHVPIRNLAAGGDDRARAIHKAMVQKGLRK